MSGAQAERAGVAVSGFTTGPYRVRPSNGMHAYVVREYACINGLSAWFIIASVAEPDDAEIGYSDGAIRSADERAHEIVSALNGQIAIAKATQTDEVSL